MNGSELKLCARTVCKKPGADWWNISTRNWYCQACALEINRHNQSGICLNPSDVSALVGARPTAQIMEELRRDLRDAVLDVSTLLRTADAYIKSGSVPTKLNLESLLKYIPSKQYMKEHRHSLPETKG